MPSVDTGNIKLRYSTAEASQSRRGKGGIGPLMAIDGRKQRLEGIGHHTMQNIMAANTSTIRDSTCRTAAVRIGPCPPGAW